MYRVLVGKTEGKRPLGRPRRRWVDNIRMDLQEVGCGYMDWIGLAQDRDNWRTLVSAVMHLQAPWNTGNFLTSCKPVSFSRRTLHHGVRVLSHQEKFITSRRHYIILGNFGLKGDSLIRTSADVFGNSYGQFCANWRKSITQWEFFVAEMMFYIAFWLLTRGKPYWLN